MTDLARVLKPCIREPKCVHPGGGKASACPVCRDGYPLRKWRQDWMAWLAENPGSEEARNGYERWVRDR